MNQLQAFDVRKVWDTIKPGLDAVRAIAQTEWRNEDMYSAILSERAFLFKPDAESSDFVILSRNVSVYSGEAYLFVIVAYSKAGDAVTVFQDDIDRIARDSGCKEIKFASPRKGWERHAKRHGYQVESTNYRREL